jgi:hypothetical protein
MIMPGSRLVLRRKAKACGRLEDRPDYVFLGKK